MIHVALSNAYSGLSLGELGAIVLPQWHEEWVFEPFCQGLLNDRIRESFRK